MARWDPVSEELKAKHQELEEERRRLAEERKGSPGFLASPVLPGEDQAEFDQLLERLRAQYQPEGIVQDDALRTMARAIWRKQHLGIFQRAAGARARWGGYFRYPNDQAGFYAIMGDMFQMTVAELERRIEPSPEAIEQPEGTLPEAGDDGNEQPHKAVEEEVDFLAAFSDIGVALKVLAPMQDLDAVLREALPPLPHEGHVVATHVSDQIVLAMAGCLITPESCLAELRMIEQLDRAIERSHNRLMKMKEDFKANRAPPKRANSPSLGWAVPRR